MDFEKVVNTRRSALYFESKEIEWEKIIKILDCARKAPSTGNLSLYNLILIKDKDKINKISDASYQEWIKTSNTIIAISMDKEKAKLLYGDKSEKLILFESAFIVENILLEATNLGLCGNFVSIFDQKEINFLVACPVECFVVLGYSKKQLKEPLKKDLKTIVKYETINQSIMDVNEYFSNKQVFSKLKEGVIDNIKNKLNHLKQKSQIKKRIKENN